MDDLVISLAEIIFKTGLLVKTSQLL